MSHTLSSTFEEECMHLRFDKELARKVESFALAFVCKNKEHMEFFGGHTVGVQIVRFLPTDVDAWFEILDINDYSLSDRLQALTSINPTWKVSSDTFNQTCMWLVHGFLTSHLLNDKDKHEAAINCLLVMHYRFVTGFLAWYFKYPADKSVAEATYARLNNKFLLKQLGSWSAVLRFRAEEIIKEGGLHYKTFISYNDDKAIINALNDIQGGIRGIWKKIYSVFIDTNNRNIKITSSSSVVELDGESVLKDKTGSLLAYNRYIATIITDKNSFIKEELVDVVAKIIHTLPRASLVTTLEWLSNNYAYGGGKDVDDLVSSCLIHSFGYLNENRSLLRHNSDLSGLISRLRGVWMSARSTDPELMKLRSLGESIVKKATGATNENTIASIRTGILSYIVLRAFSMRHYSS